MTLRVSKTRRAVVVTVPLQCRMDEAGRFLKSHIEWVRDRLGRVPEPVPFADGAQIPLRGKLHRVRFNGRSARGKAVVDIGAPGSSTPSLNVCGRVEHAARRLRDWLAQQALADLDERVSWHARQLAVRPRRIGLRDQTSRWGSCSSSGLLSFSWRLILAPPLVLDYVAAHEVAHLVEMNHGAALLEAGRRVRAPPGRGQGLAAPRRHRPAPLRRRVDRRSRLICHPGIRVSEYPGPNHNCIHCAASGSRL